MPKQVNLWRASCHSHQRILPRVLPEEVVTAESRDEEPGDRRRPCDARAPPAVRPAVAEGWKPWGDPKAILEIWNKAAYIADACSSVYKPWHFPWTDQLNIEVQKCLTGQITPDVCCDNLIKGIADAKRKV